MSAQSDFPSKPTLTVAVAIESVGKSHSGHYHIVFNLPKGSKS